MNNIVTSVINRSGIAGKNGAAAQKQAAARQPERRPAAMNNHNNQIEIETARLREAYSAIESLKNSARRELALTRQLRAEAEKYQRESASRARSQAQQLILKARIATQKETEELIRKASAEIQKVLADIRVIRITAQEELQAQRKFTSAARIKALSLALQSEGETEPSGNGKKKLAVKS